VHLSHRAGQPGCDLSGVGGVDARGGGLQRLQPVTQVRELCRDSLSMLEFVDAVAELIPFCLQA